MARRFNLALPFREWPDVDQGLFATAHPRGDIFDRRRNAQLSERTVYARRSAYGQFLKILVCHRPDQLSLQPDQRLTADNLRLATEVLGRNCSEHTVAIFLQKIYLTARAMYPIGEWGWMYLAQRRLQIRAAPLPHREVLSSQVYPVGLMLMEKAIAETGAGDTPTMSSSEIFRDGLMIALLAEQPMRRAELAALRIDDHLEKIGDQWIVNIPPELVKTHHARRYELSARLSALVEVYLSHYRPIFPNAQGHSSMWPYKDRPMSDKMIRRYVRKRTQDALGFAVTPHRFRNAAATFTSVADPANIRMAKGLLGHASLAVTEKHYVEGSRSRLAGRAHASAWDALAEAARLSV